LECFKDYISVEKDILEQQEYEKFRINSIGLSDDSVNQIRYENWQELTTQKQVIRDQVKELQEDTERIIKELKKINNKIMIL